MLNPRFPGSGDFETEEAMNEESDFCPCTRSCPRHGNCAACVANHRFRTPGVPACFFTKEGEAWHDRSYEALLRDIRENRGCGGE